MRLDVEAGASNPKEGKEGTGEASSRWLFVPFEDVLPPPDAPAASTVVVHDEEPPEPEPQPPQEEEKTKEEQEQALEDWLDADTDDDEPEQQERAEHGDELEQDGNADDADAAEDEEPEPAEEAGMRRLLPGGERFEIRTRDDVIYRFQLALDLDAAAGEATEGGGAGEIRVWLEAIERARRARLAGGVQPEADAGGKEKG